MRSITEIKQIATDAYIFGYPLIVLAKNFERLTNTVTANERMAPMGQFTKMRSYPDANFRLVPAPNADALYTMGWLDLSKEPWILTIPEMDDRYYLMQMLSGWSEVFQAPGSRTTGGKAQKYAITAPGWKGTLPAGVTEYKSPTSLVWILGRIYCTGKPEDYQKVHILQDECSMVPLSFYGKSHTPSPGKVDNAVDMKTPVNNQIAAMSLVEYFSFLAKLMKTNPPTADDSAMVAEIAKIGLVPGQDFDSSVLKTLDEDSLKIIPSEAMARMADRYKDEKSINGWLYFNGVGNFGTDYLLRATANMLGPGWNTSKDAVYPATEKDKNGNEYNGTKHNYVLHFNKGELPPVNGFWSLTMYDGEYFFVPNSLNRYNLNQRDKLVTNEDGSVDLYIQSKSPGKLKESNWLPAPEGKFVLMLRLYWPKETSPSILDGTWKVPAVSMVH